MAAQKITKKVLAQLRRLFRRDMDTLESDYQLWEIADKTGIDQANLSSYKSGAKQPGIKVLKKFYTAFNGILENPFDKLDIMEDEKKSGSSSNFTFDQKEGSDSAAHDEETNFKDDATGLTSELIATLKTHNEHLRTINIRLLDSGDKIVASHDKTNQATVIMAETYRKIIDRFLGENGGQQAKS
jgi:transcriptional regulator with XRE-family HTH domain